MRPEILLARLRRFLLAVSGGLFVGTVIELGLAEHTESLEQWIPFALCGLGLVMVALALAYPRRATLLALRGSMLVIAAGSLFGLYQHLNGNLAFELEIHPTASLAEALPAALSGVAPLLAPGILALGAGLALAATYYHPALEQPGNAGRAH